MLFVDSNVILDVITADPLWQAWSEEQLSRWLDRGPLLINPSSPFQLTAITG